jgi:hypothetical protein
LGRQGLAQGAKEGGQAQNVRLAKWLFENVRHDQAILESVAGPGRCLGSVAQHAQSSSRGTHEVGRVEVEVGAHGYAVTRAQEGRIAEHEARWQKALTDELLRAVDVLHDAIDEGSPLGQALGKHRIICSVQQRGQGIEMPGSIARSVLAGNAVAYAVVAYQLPGLIGERMKARRSESVEEMHERLRHGPRAPGRIAEFVPDRRRGTVRSRKYAGFLRGRGVLVGNQVVHRRRSGVNGKA